MEKMNPDFEWYSLRKHILTTFMTVLLIAALPVLISNNIKLFDPSTPIQKVFVYIVSNFGYLLTLCIFLIRNRIPLKMQYLFMIIANMLFGLIGEFVFGNSGLTIFFFFIASFLTEFYFEAKWMFLVFGISITAMIGIGYLFVSGLVMPAPNVIIGEGATQLLLVRVLTYLFFASAILYFISKTKHYLFSTIEYLKSNYADLSKMNLDLNLVQDELKLKYKDLEEKESRIYNMAYFDHLTGLPNKTLFEETFIEEIENSKASNQRLALVYVDLDNIKNVNTSKGRYAGDEIIIRTSESITSFLSEDAMAARMGGDEFAIILKEMTGGESIEDKIRQLIRTISTPHFINGSSCQLTSCIGIAIYPTDADHYDELLNCATAAMYQSKADGKNSYKFYSRDIKREAQKRMEIETHLHNALQNNEIEVFYQPIVDAETEIIKRVEALMRWNSPELGFVPPVTFVPILEETKRIIEFGDYIMRKSCQQNRYWNKTFGKNIVTAINISTLQLLQADFVEKVDSIIKETGIHPNNLELEITESLMIYDFNNANNQLARLRNLGISISLDDFGTGFSSLNYLRSLNIDTLKIDKSFVDDLLESDSVSIIGSIISLAHDLNLEVVAEGVETKSQRELLKSNKCNLLQGFFFCKPLSESEVFHKLKYGLDVPEKQQ
ncbi:hypothetical protein MASR2M70_12760 [Bacillota bacterium]